MGKKVVPIISAGVSDHGLLSGLTDDDHQHYLLADGTRPLTGHLTAPNYTVTPYTNDDQLTTKRYVDGVALSGVDLSQYLRKDGGTMTGSLTLAGAPSAALQAATKSYVDTKALSVDGSNVMLAPLTLVPPISDLHAATKKYVDDKALGAGGGVTTDSGYYIVATANASVEEKDIASETLAQTMTGAQFAALLTAHKRLMILGANDTTGITLSSAMMITDPAVASDIDLLGNNVIINLPYVNNSRTNLAPGAAFGIGGNKIYTPVVPSANWNRGADSFQYATGHSYEIGDWWCVRGLQDEDVINNANPTEYVAAEWHEVINQNANQVWIDENVYFDYSTPYTGLTYYRIRPARNIKIRGFRFKKIATNDTSSSYYPGVGVHYAENVLIENCSISGAGRTYNFAGFVLGGCKNVTMKNCHIDNINDSTNVDGKTYGYGIYQLGSKNVMLDGIVSSAGQHALDIGQHWIDMGVPRYTTLQNSVASNSMEMAWSTHGSEYQQFYNNIAYNCAGALQIRGKNTVVDGLWVFGTNAAVPKPAIKIGGDNDIANGMGGQYVYMRNTFIDMIDNSISWSDGIGCIIEDSLYNSDIEITSAGTQVAVVEFATADIQNSRIKVVADHPDGWGITVPIWIWPTRTGTIKNNTFIVKINQIGLTGTAATGSCVVFQPNGGTITVGSNHYELENLKGDGKGMTIFGVISQELGAVQYIDKLHMGLDNWASGDIENQASLVLQKPSYVAY